MKSISDKYWSLIASFFITPLTTKDPILTTVTEHVRTRERELWTTTAKQEGIKVSRCYYYISSTMATLTVLTNQIKKSSPSVAITHSALHYQAQLEQFSIKHTKI